MQWQFHGLEDHPPLRDFLREKYRILKKSPLATDIQFSPFSIYDNRFKQGIEKALQDAFAHFENFDESKLIRFFMEKENKTLNWTWKTWYQYFPLNRNMLPAIWELDYGWTNIDEKILQPDHQVLMEKVPADFILGAIQISDGRKILQELRPNARSETTLESHLWKKVHELKARYRGKPLKSVSDRS